MKMIEVAVLSDASNNPVVRMPGRKFPGVVIQGDSLKHLQSTAQELYHLAEKLEMEVIIDLASEINDLLSARVNAYEAVLKENNIDPPY